jgi:hypothetical protein
VRFEKGWKIAAAAQLGNARVLSRVSRLRSRTAVALRCAPRCAPNDRRRQYLQSRTPSGAHHRLCQLPQKTVPATLLQQRPQWHAVLGHRVPLG